MTKVTQPHTLAVAEISLRAAILRLVIAAGIVLQPYPHSSRGSRSASATARSDVRCGRLFGVPM